MGDCGDIRVLLIARSGFDQAAETHIGNLSHVLIDLTTLTVVSSFLDSGGTLLFPFLSGEDDQPFRLQTNIFVQGAPLASGWIVWIECLNRQELNICGTEVKVVVRALRGHPLHREKLNSFAASDPAQDLHGLIASLTCTQSFGVGLSRDFAGAGEGPGGGRSAITTSRI